MANGGRPSDEVQSRVHQPSGVQGGRVEPVEFTDYQSLAKRFQEEVFELWKREEGRQEGE